MTYVSPVFAHARPDRFYDLQIVQNKFCRRAADAPWSLIRCASRASRSPALNLQSVLQTLRDLLYRGARLKGTRRAVTRRRHHYVEKAAF
ncbi:hypothetical protein EVAR_14211_1 [Eumeta japonica]|uniref:Uncharacterized protein n=1 Tax=Eumeta variegata TaxID=151549 RepID=A0A4C1UFJ0_EUMVA|nr:hypothetical protein EVAR_14211_1 [Eumeta japonica]